jgi:hypothetical protein
MKRDMELIRLLLLERELDKSPPELASYSEQDVLYNLTLMEDAELIVVSFIGGNGGIPTGADIVRLTWAGHDFLDATRDSKIWKMAKEHVIKPGASWTFSILVEWLKQQARERVFGDSKIS